VEVIYELSWLFPDLSHIESDHPRSKEKTLAEEGYSRNAMCAFN
jgi:hypothetical protein